MINGENAGVILWANIAESEAIDRGPLMRAKGRVFERARVWSFLRSDWYVDQVAAGSDSRLVQTPAGAPRLRRSPCSARYLAPELALALLPLLWLLLLFPLCFGLVLNLFSFCSFFLFSLFLFEFLLILFELVLVLVLVCSRSYSLFCMFYFLLLFFIHDYFVFSWSCSSRFSISFVFLLFFFLILIFTVFLFFMFVVRLLVFVVALLDKFGS